MKMEIKEIMKAKCFNGFQYVYEHSSRELGCQMKFAIFIPSCVRKDSQSNYPVLYYLSGLTCTEQNFITKSGFQQFAEKYRLIVVSPDTSPRNCNVRGEDDSWDFGTGAGFYVDATQEPWSRNYRMYSYVTKELVEVVEQNFPINPERAGISGHSMGGHGALICFLKNSTKFKSVSAFAPISNPTHSLWGKKAFLGYLGDNEEAWKNYDATELIKNGTKNPNVTILVDQGAEDEWMEYLVPENFLKACEAAGQPLKYRKHEEYNHGYFFVSTFIEDHIKHHAESLY